MERVSVKNNLTIRPSGQGVNIRIVSSKYVFYSKDPGGTNIVWYLLHTDVDSFLRKKFILIQLAL